jgi:hypothetical protein
MGPAYKEIPQTQESSSNPSILIHIFSFPQPLIDNCFQSFTQVHLRTIMPKTAEGVPSNLDAPRSPVSISTESGRLGSSKPVHPEKGAEPPTPSSNSPVTRLTRKRAASLNSESASHLRIEDLALTNANSSGPPILDPTREHVCLCQPDPKIPRPRNGA